jgi:CRISPR type III-B/RAMP module-associated protein Cmr3
MEKENYNLTVKLTPVGHYFFGTETRNTDGTENYFQYSSQLPQQTMLLGMLRYLLLQTSPDIFNNGKILNKTNAKGLIGPESFNMESTNFGAIKKISEIALWDNNGQKLYLPLFVWKDENSDIIAKIEMDIEANCFYNCNLKAKPLFSLPGYSAKKSIEQIWITDEGREYDQKQRNLFTEDLQAGNHKKKKLNKEDDDTDAYFKMQFYRLRPQFSFLLNIKVCDSVIERLTDQKHYVVIGSDKSSFLCEIYESSNETLIENKYADIYNPWFEKHATTNQFVKVILTSDACFIENNPYEHSLWAITQTKQFRFLRSSVAKTEQYYNRSKSGEQKMEESELFNLLQRGSVLYFNINEDIDKFLNNPVYSIIGYNRYYKF